MSQGNDVAPHDQSSNRRRRVAIAFEVSSVLVLIAGSFLYLQYGNLSSLCVSTSHSDPCWKWAIRSDVGGLVGVVTGFFVGWLRDRG